MKAPRAERAALGQKVSKRVLLPIPPPNDWVAVTPGVDHGLNQHQTTRHCLTRTAWSSINLFNMYIKKEFEPLPSLFELSVQEQRECTMIHANNDNAVKANTRNQQSTTRRNTNTSGNEVCSNWRAQTLERACFIFCLPHVVLHYLFAFASALNQIPIAFDNPVAHLPDASSTSPSLALPFKRHYFQKDVLDNVEPNG